MGTGFTYGELTEYQSTAVFLKWASERDIALRLPDGEVVSDERLLAIMREYFDAVNRAILAKFELPAEIVDDRIQAHLDKEPPEGHPAGG